MKFFVPLLALVASAAALPATDDGAVRPVRSVDRGEEDPPKPVRAEDLKFHLGDRTVCGTEDNLENIICYQSKLFFKKISKLFLVSVGNIIL